MMIGNELVACFIAAMTGVLLPTITSGATYANTHPLGQAAHHCCKGDCVRLHAVRTLSPKSVAPCVSCAIVADICSAAAELPEAMVCNLAMFFSIWRIEDCCSSMAPETDDTSWLVVFTSS